MPEGIVDESEREHGEEVVSSEEVQLCQIDGEDVRADVHRGPERNGARKSGLELEDGF